MSTSYWQQQGKEPLYPDILWSRPESKHGAGKLLIIGGNAYGFSAPATAYAVSNTAGIGVVRVLLPHSLEKLVGHMEGAFFAPQNASGSFSKQSLNDMLVHASWADAVLLAGELGRNSETAVTLETFVKKYTGLLIITKDAVDYFLHTPNAVLERQHTCVVLSIEQLQKYGIHAKYKHAVTFGMSLTRLVDWLHDFTLQREAVLVVLHQKTILVAYKGNVITHAVVSDEKSWRVETASKASVYWLQNPHKPLEAIATSFLEK